MREARGLLPAFRVLLEYDFVQYDFFGAAADFLIESKFFFIIYHPLDIDAASSDIIQRVMKNER